MFKENPTVGLSEVSRLTDSAISKRPGDQRKHSFPWEREYSIKRKMDSCWTHGNIASLD